MPSWTSQDFRLGILGGGQLGKMLLHQAQRWNLHTQVLDPDSRAPARYACTEFHVGSLTDYDTVMQFGRGLDVLTIEIEHVNARALADLARLGAIVHPDPGVLPTIQDKGLQRSALHQAGIPGPRFELFADADAVRQAVHDGRWSLPFVQKLRTEGYDGRGVSILRDAHDLNRLFDRPCLVEELVEIERELGLLAAQDASGRTACYPAVEMEFHPHGNLVDWLIAPADVPEDVEAEAEAVAIRTLQAFGIRGLLAVEMFVTRDGRVLVNEVAPRPHNSGHHTIEAAATSQYEQHLRAILDLPLGPTRLHHAAAMVNLLGEPGFHGPPILEGAEQCLAIEGVHLHIYGKAETRPLRKMGHVTIIGSNRAEVRTKAKLVKNTLRIIA